MNLAWKIYFWIYLVLLVPSLAIIYSGVGLLNLASFYEILMSISILLGLYCYVFNKKIAPKIFWIFTFWYIIVIDTSYRFLYNFTILKPYLDISVPQIFVSQISPQINTIENFIVGIFVAFPAYLASYRLSKDKFLK